MEWAAEQTRPGNGGAITLAMLELGIERHLNIFPDEQSAADLVQGVLRKVLSRRREQCNDRRPAPDRNRPRPAGC